MVLILNVGFWKGEFDQPNIDEGCKLRRILSAIQVFISWVQLLFLYGDIIIYVKISRHILSTFTSLKLNVALIP
jgi:hypothetical protein